MLVSALALVLAPGVAASSGVAAARAVPVGKASGGGFEIAWFALDGGSGTAAGDAYLAAGSISTTAAPVPMTGGAFQVEGGYGPAGAPPPGVTTLLRDGFE